MGQPKKKTNSLGGKRKHKVQTMCAPKLKANKKKTKPRFRKKGRRRRKKKIEKKKALDERDLNILAQLSKLNRSIVVMNEHDRDMEEETELARKKHDPNGGETAVEGTELAQAHNVHEVNKKNAMRARDLPEIARPSWRNIEEDDEDDEEYLGTGKALDFLIIL